MKPGDLVLLKAGSISAGGVAVSWTPPGGGALDVTRFDTGTPALLLQTDEVDFRKDPHRPDRGLKYARHSVSFILIGGRMGWVWPGELEPL